VCKCHSIVSSGKITVVLIKSDNVTVVHTGYNAHITVVHILVTMLIGSYLQLQCSMCHKTLHLGSDQSNKIIIKFAKKKKKS
jgi:hypothetical protein